MLLPRPAGFGGPATAFQPCPRRSTTSKTCPKTPSGHELDGTTVRRLLNDEEWTIRKLFWKMARPGRFERPTSGSGTKTEATESGLPLLPIVREALEANKVRNAYHKWVFHRETGRPLRMDNLNARAIRPTLKKAEILWPGWHAMRRGLASNLIELGADPKIAQAILRRSNVRTTMDFYLKRGQRRP
jgi:hypothetical protein